MKNFKFFAILVLTIINEVCGSETDTVKNTGGKAQCLESAVRTYALAKNSFAFTDLATMKTQAAWDAAKVAKNIVMFYDIEELEPNNTEAIIKNGRYADYDIKDAVKGVNYTHYLSTCSHAAVKSYQNSEYKRVFRITEDSEVLCHVQDDGTIKGEPLKSFIVGIRDDAPTDGTPSTKINFKFDSYELSIVKPSFDLTDYEGIYDVALALSGAQTSSSLKFTATADCSGSKISSFVEANIVLRDAGGAVQSPTFVAADANGVYELTGSGFANGYTIEINGVVVQTGITYEGIAPLTVAGI